MSDDLLAFDDLESCLPSEEEQLAALAQLIRFSDRFSLVFAACNDIRYREALITRLQKTLEGVPTEVLRLTDEITNLLDVLQSQPLESVRALFVVGMEGWIPSGSEGERHPFILNLNAARDAFPVAFKGTLVLWAPRYLLASLHRGAPDFFSVRSGLYAFAPSEAERTRLTEELTRYGWAETISLSREDKERRIDQLEHLLNETLAAPEDQRDREAMARIHETLANTYRAHGFDSEALPHSVEALSIRKQELGERHTSTLVSMGNLAETYRAMGMHADALGLQEDALAAHREVLGERHPDTLTSMNNLAGTYLAMGRHADALGLQKEALAASREVLGERHPSTLTSMNNLASTYRAMGRHADALGLQKEALAASREILGERHPSTLTSMNNLAGTYRAMGRHADAYDMLSQALEGLEAALGPDHPNTKAARENLQTLRDEMDNDN